MQKIHMIFNLDAKKKLLILFQKSLSKENVYLVCLGRLQSVRDRQFGLIFNQLKVRESMYWCHPKSNHNSFGYIPDQQEERKRKRTHYKEEKNWFKVDEIKMSVSDKIMVCLGRLGKG